MCSSHFPLKMENFCLIFQSTLGEVYMKCCGRGKYYIELLLVILSWCSYCRGSEYIKNTVLVVTKKEHFNYFYFKELSQLHFSLLAHRWTSLSIPATTSSPAGSTGVHQDQSWKISVPKNLQNNCTITADCLGKKNGNATPLPQCSFPHHFSKFPHSTIRCSQKMPGLICGGMENVVLRCAEWWWRSEQLSTALLLVRKKLSCVLQLQLLEDWLCN